MIFVSRKNPEFWIQNRSSGDSAHKIMTSKCVLGFSDPEGGVRNPKMVKMGKKWHTNHKKINFLLWPQKYDLEGKIEVVGQHWSEIY